MPWFKVDDSLAFNAKFVALPLAAAGLWLRAGAWCAQQLTDGRVPASIVVALGGRDDDVAALVDARLWRRVKDGFTFHDWADYQPTADDVRAEREAARTRMRELRNRRKGKGRDTGGSEPPANEPSTDDEGSEDVPANTDGTFTTPGVDVVPVPRPIPSHPDPSRPDPGSTSGESFRGGGTSGTREGGEPPARCPRHLESPAAGNCGPCGDARRAHEAWTAARAQARRDSGPVVGGHRCPQHPTQPAARCPDCARTATPMPDAVRDELKRRRAG